MNIVIVMSGGVGARFGAVIPKQYNLISGRPVIDYVLDAVESSEHTDHIVVVMDSQWKEYSTKIRQGNYDIAVNGTTRLQSMYNALKLIKKKYACDKIVIVDAVGPFLYANLIDEYFCKLDTYDAVITAQRITGGFTDIDCNVLDRENYIITQSPEGFRFELLWNSFDVNYPYQETAGMLPKGTKWFFNYDFKNNLKLTYDYELTYAEFVLKNMGKVSNHNNIAFFDKSVLVTEGIKSYLLRNEYNKTIQWIDTVYSSMPTLISKWEITSFLPNQISRFGIVLQAKSRVFGDVIIKFVPDFIGRYYREVEALKYLPKSYMCQLIDTEEECHCMLLEKITPARFACFEENLKLTEFFKHVINDAVPYSKSIELSYIPFYIDELREKLANTGKMPYCKEQVEKELNYAVELYEEKFSDCVLYIIHGDLHEQNILDNGKRFYGIDPNGMIGPLELECVRFIRNDVRNHPSFGFEQRFEILLQSFSRFVDISKLVNLFIIDMAFCSYNSVFENQDPKETYDNLELIQIAKKWKSKHNDQ